MTREDKGKYLAKGVWVCKVPKKETGFDLECLKETFKEQRKALLRHLPPEVRRNQLKPIHGYHVLRDLHEVAM